MLASAIILNCESLIVSSFLDYYPAPGAPAAVAFPAASATTDQIRSHVGEWETITTARQDSCPSNGNLYYTRRTNWRNEDGNEVSWHLPINTQPLTLPLTATGRVLRWSFLSVSTTIPSLRNNLFLLKQCDPFTSSVVCGSLSQSVVVRSCVCGLLRSCPSVDRSLRRICPVPCGDWHLPTPTSWIIAAFLVDAVLKGFLGYSLWRLNKDQIVGVD